MIRWFNSSKLKFKRKLNFFSSVPLRMKLPSSWNEPLVFPSSLFTAEFFDRFSNVKCWTSFSSWFSLRDLPRNWATFSIPPRKSCKSINNDLYNHTIIMHLADKYFFQIFVEKKENIFFTLCTFPGVQNLSKVRRIKHCAIIIIQQFTCEKREHYSKNGKWNTNFTLVLHKTVSETFQITIKVVKFYQSVVVVIRDDDVFGITCDVYNLVRNKVRELSQQLFQSVAIYSFQI